MRKSIDCTTNFFNRLKERLKRDVESQEVFRGKKN